MLKKTIIIIITLLTVIQIATAFQVDTSTCVQDSTGGLTGANMLYSTNSSDNQAINIVIWQDGQVIVNQTSTISTQNQSTDISVGDVNIDYSTTTTMLFHMLVIIMAFIVAGFAESKKAGFGIWGMVLWFFVIALYSVSENAWVGTIYFVFSGLPLLYFFLKKFWGSATT